MIDAKNLKYNLFVSAIAFCGLMGASSELLSQLQFHSGVLLGIPFSSMSLAFIFALSCSASLFFLRTSIVGFKSYLVFSLAQIAGGASAILVANLVSHNTRHDSVDQVLDLWTKADMVSMLAWATVASLTMLGFYRFLSSRGGPKAEVPHIANDERAA